MSRSRYEAERTIAVYPCKRGQAGHANAQGVLQPWLDAKDLCEPYPNVHGTPLPKYMYGGARLVSQAVAPASLIATG
jgi:hypothetical protein